MKIKSECWRVATPTGTRCSVATESSKSSSASTPHKHEASKIEAFRNKQVPMPISEPSATRGLSTPLFAVSCHGGMSRNASARDVLFLFNCTLVLRQAVRSFPGINENDSLIGHLISSREI